MITRITCVAVAFFFLLPAFGQTDTTRAVNADSLALLDSTRIDTIAKAPVNTAPKVPVYKLKPAVDIPIVAVGAGWSLYAFTQIYSKTPSTQEEILELDVNNINSFDRRAVRPFSESIDKASYYPFFAVMPMPFVFLTGKKTKKDFFKLTFLYLEAMSITGMLYTASTYFTDRYRPYAYSSESTMDQRTRGGAKNSFYAGHVALVATATFFGAKVHADYNPDSKIKWLLYTLAGATTATVAVMRYEAGQHFPSDLIIGAVQGTLTGFLVPHFHKHKIIKDPNLSLMPYTNGRDHMLSLVYRLK